MPHQCTDCGRQFDDGSKEMLSGCPECGGNKFQFLPAAQMAESEPEPPGSPDPDSGTDRSVARTVGNAATAVRDLVGNDSEPPSTEQPATAEKPTRTPSTTPSETSSTTPSETSSTRQTSSPEPAAASMAESEDEAQASARTDVISPDELPPSPQQEWPETGATEREEEADESDERPDLSELRAELNQQFESIKVLEPGQYELNLMELFDREEYIVALQEDGKYTVQVPENWK